MTNEETRTEWAGLHVEAIALQSQQSASGAAAPTTTREPAPSEYVKVHGRITDESRSALRRYQDLIVGSRGVWYTFKYEVITAASQAPGALGLLLRKKLYRCLCGRLGRGAIFGARVVLRSPLKIEIGAAAVLSDGCVLDARGEMNSGIRVGDRFMLGQRSMLMCKDGDIVIGDDVSINANSSLYAVGGNRLTIGDNVLIGPYVYIGGTPYRTDRTDVSIAEQGPAPRGGISIGAGCWIGARVTILDGVTIGTGCVIGAGSIVRDNLPDFTSVTPHQRLILVSRRRSGEEGG